MNNLLRKSTSQIIRFGPFLDSTDGVTAETGLTIAQADMQFSKDGAAFAQKNASGNATHDVDGYYSTTLNTTDTATNGILEFQVTVAGACPVWKTYTVVPAVTYDALMATGLNNVAATAIVSAGAISTLAGAVITTTNVTNEVTADVTAISGDSDSADNLELQYDGTGLSGDTFPSSQSQLGGLANVGSAVHTVSDGYVLTTGTQSANLYTDTAALDGTLHQHTDDAGAIDLYYEFNIGAGTPSSVQVTGYVTGGNDDIGVYGYDWEAAAWVQVGTFEGTNSSANRVESFDLFIGMAGAGADHGKVRVRFYEASGLTTAVLAIDQIFAAFSQGAEGYINGAIWYDDSKSNTNTVPGTDGVAGNEVSTEAAVATLLTSTGLHKVNVSPGGTYTLASTHNNMIVEGHGAILALGGQDVDETHFLNFSDVSGVGTAAGTMEFHDCEIFTASVQKAHFYACTFDATVTFTLAGDHHLINCQSGVPGAGSPTFAKTAGQAVTVEFRRWSGGVAFTGLEVGDTLTISGEMGTIDLGSPAGAVAIEIRGSYKAITNVGSATVGLAGAFLAGDVATTLADTNELQTDWANAGRLDAILDSRMAEASINTTAGVVDNVATVALVDLTTENTDMVGTDDAATATGMASAFTEIKGATWAGTDTLEAIFNQAAANNTAIGALNDISLASIFTTQLTESYAADGVAPTLAQAIMMIQQLLGNFAIVGTTITTHKIDKLTTAATHTLDDATNPTSRTRTT